jgi:hypothetical protein
LAGREALRRAPAAVFEKPWGDHVDRDAFGHEELCRVRIDRTLQSFPPSKRSGRLSTHSAFQLGRMTLIRQIRLDDGEAHQQASCRPLLSSLHLFTILLFGLP